jgi:hypothetical protein
MAHVGRPRVLDDGKRREICAIVARGGGIEGAAKYVGCAPSTIRREALRNVDFHEELRKAEVAAELEPLNAIRQSAGTQWRAAAWLLERLDPQRFGRRNPRLLSPEQLASAFDCFFEAISEEISDPALCRQVFNRLTAEIEQYCREHWAAEHRRYDARKAKRFLEAFQRGKFAQVKRNIECATKRLEVKNSAPKKE